MSQLAAVVVFLRELQQRSAAGRLKRRQELGELGRDLAPPIQRRVLVVAVESVLVDGCCHILHAVTDLT